MLGCVPHTIHTHTHSLTNEHFGVNLPNNCACLWTVGNQKAPAQTSRKVKTFVQACAGPVLITSRVKAKFPTSSLVGGQTSLPALPPCPPSCAPPHPPQRARLRARGDAQELLIPGGGSSHGVSAAAVQRSTRSGSSEIECGRSIAGSYKSQRGPVHFVTLAGQ